MPMGRINSPLHLSTARIFPLLFAAELWTMSLRTGARFDRNAFLFSSATSPYVFGNLAISAASSFKPFLILS